MENSNASEKVQFLLQKYQNFTNVLSRIKIDEKNWIKVLLLVFSGLFAFSFSLTTQGTKIIQIVGNRTFILSYILLVSIFVLYWLHEASNMRIQYYRTMLRLHRVDSDLASLVKSAVSVQFDENFKKWYWKITRPYESRMATHILPLLLSLACCIFHSYLALSLIKKDSIAISSSLYLFVVYILFINVILFFVFQERDRRSLRALHKEHAESFNRPK